MSEPNWTDPALVFPRPEDAPLIGEYAFITAASVATQVLYLNGYPANKLKNGGANFYTQQDGTVSTKSPTQPPVKPPTKPPVEPAWEPAKSYASSSKMVSDLMTHHFPNQVLLDGGQVIQFANGFGPPLQYFTHPDYSVKQTQPAKPVKPPTTDLPAQPPTVGGLVVLPWGGEVRTGEQGAPSMGGDSIYMLSLTVPHDWPLGPAVATISIAEHGSSGGQQQRRAILKDGTGTVLANSLDTKTDIAYSVGGEAGKYAVLMPGAVYTLSVQNEGPNRPPATTNFVAHWYAPAG